MQFSLSSLLIALTIASSVAATPTGEATKREAQTGRGDCNGTSCQIVFANFECNVGSCAGSQGGDGKPCSVIDNSDGTRTTYCPGCGDPEKCPSF
ncbi:uncharacterized protein F4822DRAFT_8255 [Hypoxylon trugodes]|uniref:uncharacterized protein n=1 Tax=Hypoxylon trugodes TaxID=326681 RepID=UPI00218F3809|nr:uncharacterized protein F4822DRAFT_8255 [Hypoxylon trugodes]KAI1393316.1 hypothetical protein F4822DRAFT_8255 [Hypoxylon trugodes]